MFCPDAEVEMESWGGVLPVKSYSLMADEGGGCVAFAGGMEAAEGAEVVFCVPVEVAGATVALPVLFFF